RERGARGRCRGSGCSARGVGGETQRPRGARALFTHAAGPRALFLLATRGAPRACYFRGGGLPAGALALRSPEWPWNVRVGANSPCLWPTMFSVTNTGTNLRPLCTVSVRPTASGVMVERRDHVLMGVLDLFACAVSIFAPRCRSTNGPFLSERAM